jgi:ATP-dependent DNA helicase DinG
LLSAASPSRLLDAFPPGTPVSRVALDEAVSRVRLSLQSRLRHEAAANA